MSTYREELCNKDEIGVPLFSPYCRPGRTVDLGLTKQVQSTYGDLNCHVQSVDYPRLNRQAMAEQQSAKDWFKDPTYAEHMAMKLQGVDFDKTNTNPSLKLYHAQKDMEKASISLMSTL